MESALEDDGLTESALFAIVVATVAGLIAGRAYARSRHRALRDRPGFRTSPHYAQGLHYLASGQPSLAMTELQKVIREDPDAVDVLQVLSHLQRETGRVERAIHIHQGLLARGDLTRSETAHTMASLGADFRKAGFLDRAAQAFAEALAHDPNNLYALMGLRKLHEDHQCWAEAYEVQVRLARLRKADDGLVLGHLRTRIGEGEALAGNRAAAEAAFLAALSLDRRVVPAYLGLADLYEEQEPSRALAVLESLERTIPDRAYLAFERLERVHTRLAEPDRFVQTCERIIRQDPRDWRARLALARNLRSRGHLDEALGLLLRALETNGQGLLVHLEVLRSIQALGELGETGQVYLRAAEQCVFYIDPHLCVECGYRADGMLWRCPHCHEWNTLVEERVAPLVS